MTEQQPEKTLSWKCRKLCKNKTFGGISVDVLQLGKEKHGWSEIRTKLENIKMLTPNHTISTVEYIGFPQISHYKISIDHV